ncbi:MAG: DUF2330 domain-containing protein [Acidimicrobiales bacterium]
MRRVLLSLAAGTLGSVMAAAPALACGGLIGRNGAVNLVRTTTLAAYADGVEHYVTSFEFAGAGGEFGSIVPLPGVPTAVERGGKWTLQRLNREVSPPPATFARGEARAVASADAEVLLETRIDALDITVLRGGSEAVGRWAGENGFLLPPDAPEVLAFYAERSPIFMAARFDADAAAERGVALGDGTPIHLSIPTDNPWVPLRILGLGRQPAEQVEADVFLLTESKPRLLAADQPKQASARDGRRQLAPGLTLSLQRPASNDLLGDLRSDDGMGWIPSSMWLSHLEVRAAPDELTYDLAIDASGRAEPSRRAAGLAEVVAGDVPLPVDLPARLNPAPEANETPAGRGLGLPLAAMIAVGALATGAVVVAARSGR